MVFPIGLTAVLSGASPRQLAYWRKPTAPLLVPEQGSSPRVLYSFRDVLALRTVVKLRTDTSLQSIRAAFRTLQNFDLTEHPSRYHLVGHGNSIVLVTSDDVAIDLVRDPGARLLATMDDIFAGFVNKGGREVVNFLHPRPHLDVREHRLGGWPTAADTRVPFDSVAQLMATGEVSPEEVSRFYPTVTAEAARDAYDLAAEVDAIKRPA